MKLDIVAGSKNDEFYTPEYAIAPILKFEEIEKAQAQEAKEQE